MSFELTRTEGGPLDGPFLDRFALWVAVPSQDTWIAGFAMSVLQMQMQLFTTHVGQHNFINLSNRNGSMLAQNREEMILDALEHEQKVSHILMLDSDMLFPADTAHWLAWRNKPIVMANYTRRSVPTLPTVRGKDGRLLATLDTSTGLENVRYGGLGVCMVHREVFEKIPRPWFHFDWVKDENARGGWGMVGEDVYFFRKCHEHGYQVLCDHDLSKHVSHIGQFEYTHRMAFLDEEEGVYDEDGNFNPETKLEWLRKKEEEAKGGASAA